MSACRRGGLEDGVEEGTGAERMAVGESHGPTVARAKVKENIFILEN